MGKLDDDVFDGEPDEVARSVNGVQDDMSVQEDDDDDSA